MVRTPLWQLDTPRSRQALGPGSVGLKLELLQKAGSFKPRGALNVMLSLSDEQRARGVTAVSAGNHAMAVAYAASALESSAKVVMPKNANPGRVAGAKALGAEVVLVDDVHAAFAEVERIASEEGRTFVHPFEGPLTAAGTAGVGLEIVEDLPALMPQTNLARVIVPIGGGGLAAGVAAAVKLASPHTQVIGVEPEGADTMWRSRQAGSPQSIDKVRTIADSLGAPHAAPYSFALCERYIDELVRVSDTQLVAGMRLLAEEAKLAVEPAGAATCAALMGPLRELPPPQPGVTVAIVCGANIDAQSFAKLVLEGPPNLA